MLCCVIHSYQWTAWHSQMGVSNYTSNCYGLRGTQGLPLIPNPLPVFLSYWMPLLPILLCKPETYKSPLMPQLQDPQIQSIIQSTYLFPQAITLVQHTFISCVFFLQESYSVPPQAKKTFKMLTESCHQLHTCLKYCKEFPFFLEKNDLKIFRCSKLKGAYSLERKLWPT